MNILFRTYTLLFFSSLLFLPSCDIIEDPVVPFDEGYRADLYGEAPIFGAALPSMKNVVIEDFTAHQCGNCPPAAEIAESLAETNPDRVFPIAIHAGNLSTTSTEYPTDWTSPEGDVFWNQLDFQANPLGRVNRIDGSGNFFAPAEWSEKVDQELALACPLSLQVETSWYPNAGHLNIHVNGQFSGPCAGENRLSVLITESGLLGDQLYYGNNPEHVEDYEFNHLLRGSVSGANGLVVIANPEIGSEFQSDFTFNWNEEWVFENSSIIIVASTEEGYVINCLGHHLGE